ncbi:MULTISPECIES: type I secretion system permease/ATPase [Cupriavidus]
MIFRTTRMPQGDIGRALGACRGALRTVGAFSAVVNLLMLAPSLYMLQVYDRVLPARNEMTLLMLTLMTLGLMIFMAALEYLRSLVVIRVGSQIDARLNERIYAAAFEANLGASPGQAGPDAGQALNDLTTLRQFVTGNALFAFFDAPWFPVYLAVIFLFDPWLGLLALAGSAVLVALAWLNERLSQPALAAAGRLAVQSGSVATASLRHAEAIAAMGMLAALRARWFALHAGFLAHQRAASEKAAAVGAATRFARLALQSLMLGLGALLAVEGRITPGMMIAGSILMGRTLAPIETLIAVWKQWSAARLAHGRLAALLDAHPPRPRHMSLPPPAGRLEVEQAGAVAPGGRQAVLAQVSFALAPGDVLGVIGPSAGGKSSLARVLVGAWPLAAGRVRLDGADLHQRNADELGPALGYLPQAVSLFAGTIGENIARFGAVDARRVVEAAELAGVHDMILRLPQGYDTLLGDDGAGLSGGQRQRIGLARALYGDPALVVLDEPNASLDDEGEAALARALQALRARGRTVVVITHRMPLLAATTRLLLLRAGRMHAFGPTPAVLASMQAASQTAPAAPAAPAQSAQAAQTAPVPRTAEAGA